MRASCFGCCCGDWSPENGAKGLSGRAAGMVNAAAAALICFVDSGAAAAARHNVLPDLH
jgi:hypothetical protein